MPDIKNAKSAYFHANEAYNEAHKQYISVCNLFEIGRANHDDIETAWRNVQDAETAKWYAWDQMNNAYITVTFERHDPDKFRSGIRALVEGGRNYS